MEGNEPTPEEGMEPIDAPVEGSEDAEVASPPSIDDYARKRGWTSKEEWVEAGKDEVEWRDAQAFLDYGLDRSRDMGRDLKELRSTVESVRNANVIAAKEAADRARAEEHAKWEKVHEEAVELGDKEVARQAVDKIAEASSPAQPQVDPLVVQFRAENAWFDVDPVAQAVAKAASGQAAQLGKGISEQLAAAKEAVHRRFPEYAPKQPAKAVEVAKPSSTATPPKRGKTFHDMPRENQEAARALKEAGMLPNGIEGYVKNHFNKEGVVL